MQRRSSWVDRLSIAAVVALLWAILHYLVDNTLLPRGLDRPVVVLIGEGGALVAIVVLVLLAAGAFLGALPAGRAKDLQGLLVVGLALALWTWHGGTMDDWLKAKNPIPGPATAAAYWPLLAEYAYWAIALAAVVAISTWRGGWPEQATRQGNWRRSLGFDATPAGLRDGLTALIATVVIAAVLVSVLTGPRLGHTYRGQVYFAVGVAFIIAVLVARRVAGVRGVLWYLPGPLIVGVFGVLLAAWKPTLPAGYEHINVIPAWGLVRPLPVEMVSVGLVAILLTHRTSRRLSSDDRSS